MKKQIAQLPVLLILAVTFFSCSKKNKDADEMDNKLKITDYMIVGETFWGNNVNYTPPYIMEFNSSGKAAIYTLDGKSETGYEVNGNRITLADMGYIDIENGQVINMVLAGANLKPGKLIKLAPLENKTYPKGQRMIWKANGSSEASTIAKDYEITVSGSKIIEKFQAWAGEWVPRSYEYNYTKLQGSGGVIYSGSRTLIFYVNPSDGRMVYWYLSPGVYNYYKY